MTGLSATQQDAVKNVRHVAQGACKSAKHTCLEVLLKAQPCSEDRAFGEKFLTCITQGPKLGKFKNGKHAKVHFVTGLGSGAHSHVWKVTINGGTYALKMFRHIKAEEENAASATKLDKFGVDLQLLNDQLTPFNCEARAYGRLRETGNEGIAWGCYGYIALDEATYASAVWDTIGLPRREWFSQYINTDAEVADRPVFPIYALVKEFIPDASKLGALDISKAHDMAQGINKLHSIGITHRDSKHKFLHLFTLPCVSRVF